MEAVASSCVEPSAVPRQADGTAVSRASGLEAFPDADEDVRQTAARLRANPFIPKKNIRGFVYEVKTGRLREVQAALLGVPMVGPGVAVKRRER